VTTAAPELTIARYDVSGLHEHKDELLNVYAEVYADRLDDPFFSHGHGKVAESAGGCVA
jgi:hypothetical protein